MTEPTPTLDLPGSRRLAASRTPRLDRVTEYVRQFRKLTDTGGTIHMVHTDPEAEQASLTVADLEIVATAAAREPVLYGMVWWLALQLADKSKSSAADWVEAAQRNHQQGHNRSPRGTAAARKKGTQK